MLLPESATRDRETSSQRPIRVSHRPRSQNARKWNLQNGHDLMNTPRRAMVRSANAPGRLGRDGFQRAMSSSSDRRITSEWQRATCTRTPLFSQHHQAWGVTMLLHLNFTLNLYYTTYLSIFKADVFFFSFFFGDVKISETICQIGVSKMSLKNVVFLFL